MPINELRSITTFARTTELGSLRRAAAAQRITPQAASQALAQLERHLGVRLFHRTTRSMTLPEDGQRFLEAAQPALAGLQRAMTVVRQAKDEIAGPLRIVAPRLTFVRVLWPVLDSFCRKYPDVQPDVVMEDRVGNWVEDRVDVGFRIGASPAEGVIARRLFPLQLIICAAPAYLALHGAPNTLEDLASHRCSVYRNPNTGTVLPWSVKLDDAFVDYPIPPALCTNDEGLETEAVLAGHLIGSLTNISAAEHIRSGRLVPLMTQHVSERLSVFMYFGSRASQPARVRAFIECGGAAEGQQGVRADGQGARGRRGTGKEGGAEIGDLWINVLRETPQSRARAATPATLRRDRSAASTVFAMNIVTVIGPTPPGTGVM